MICSHLLVVDDDERLRVLIKRYLSAENFAVSTACSLYEARCALELFYFDAIILDIMLPQENGLMLLTDSCFIALPPVLLVTAQGDPRARVEGLELGARDYIVKPFEPRELLLRLRQLLLTAQTSKPRQVPLGQVLWDVTTGKISHSQGGEKVLTHTEHQLLLFLARHAGSVVSREHLAQHIGAIDNLRTIDAHINRLRQKMDVDACSCPWIKTIRGQGYMVTLPEGVRL